MTGEQLGLVVLGIALDPEPHTGARQLGEALVAIDPPSIPRFAGKGTAGGARLVVEPEASTLIRWLDGDDTQPETTPDLGHHGRVLRDLSLERARQIGKGYTAAHDDAHSLEQLTGHALDRLDVYQTIGGTTVAAAHADRRALVEAAAVLVAAIESIDRRTT